MDIVEEFRKVRDIPYRIPLSLKESDDCCSGKAKRLFDIFTGAGYEVRYRLCTFLWSDLNLPQGLQALPHKDECTHSYLEVKTGDKWIIVDATWDSGLQELFTVNEWDGKSNTTVAVPIRKCFSPEESFKIIQQDTTDEVVVRDLQNNGKFYKRFNEWLGSNRK